MEFSPTTVGVLLVAALVVAFGALGTALVVAGGHRRVRRAYHRFSMGSGDDVLTLLERHLDEIARLRREVGDAHRRLDDLRELLKGSVSRIGTVRYDAFDDMGGRLSFSTALLDEHGDGVVVTAINGRTDTRTYAKAVHAGGSRHNLSEEEVAAIEQAMRRSGRTRVLKPRTGPRRPGSRPRPRPPRPAQPDGAQPGGAQPDGAQPDGAQADAS